MQLQTKQMIALLFRHSAMIGFCLTSLCGFTLFTANGTFIKWNVSNGDVVSFIINPADCDCDLTEEQIETALENSMRRWSEVRGSYFQFENLEDSSPELFEEDTTLGDTSPKYDDGLNVIGFSSDVPSPFAGFTRFKVKGDHITEADVYLGKGLDLTEKTLESLVTHELGHAFGLGHDHADVESVMSYGRDSKRLRLGVDDVIGITTIYPKSGREPKPDLGCTTIGPIDGNSPFFDQAFYNFLLIFIAIAMLLLALKHSQKKKSRIDTVAQPPLFPFFKGMVSGMLLLLVMVACGDIIMEEEETNSNHKVREVSFYFEKKAAARSVQASSPGAIIDGGDFFTLVKPVIHGDKVTFYCPKGK
ncbi:MAG: matrixin family metalloprotease [SAR324 cluster bacterium]|nr:matrixin family metalloprotease [SAR324 cluster bacterium]